jgi:hypothetical protein
VKRPQREGYPEADHDADDRGENLPGPTDGWPLSGSRNFDEPGVLTRNACVPARVHGGSLFFCEELVAILGQIMLWRRPFVLVARLVQHAASARFRPPPRPLGCSDVAKKM